MKKKIAVNENYLERIPVHADSINWSSDNSIVTLEIENRGVFNKIAQKLFKKPKISYIHLDELGSFIWQQIDGVRNIMEIGETVKDTFGEKAEPLYERLAKYCQILESYSFISWN